VDLCEADEWLRVLAIQDLLLVKVQNVELVDTGRESAVRIGLALHLEEKPVAVPFCVGVRTQVQVVLVRLHLNGEIKVARLKN